MRRVWKIETSTRCSVSVDATVHCSVVTPANFDFKYLWKNTFLTTKFCSNGTCKIRGEKIEIVQLPFLPPV